MDPTELRKPTSAQRLAPIGRSTLGLRVLVPLLTLLVILLVVVTIILEPPGPDWLVPGILAVSFVFQLVSRLLVLRPFLHPVPSIAPDRHAFVVGSERVPADRVTWAFAYRYGAPEERMIAMRWGGRGVPTMFALLEWNGAPFLEDAQADALASTLAVCPIATPRDPYDPQGRMAASIRSGSLDADQAAALVRDPRGNAELLPRGGAPRPPRSARPRRERTPVSAPAAPSAPPVGWLSLPGITLGERLASPRWIYIALPVLLVVNAVSLARIFADVTPVAVGLTVAGSVLVLGASLVPLAVASLSPEVDAAGGWMRRGRRVVSAAAITSVLVIRIRRPRRAGGEQLIGIRLAGRGVPSMTVLLFRAGASALDEDRRRALVEVVSASSARLPRDPYDPEGRMSRVANPGWLTADDAARLIVDLGELDRLLPPQPPVRRGT